ncbi:MAG: CvpA family protein [Thermodesulfobacteriota bacterium]|nr:CvpA family protein [Thermodesulfobacteriota bacterium]
MNPLDIIALVIMGIFIITGILGGFVRGISSLCSIIIGLFLARRYAQTASELMASIHIPNPMGLVSYLVIFIIFYVGIKVAFRLVQKITRASVLSWPDRAMGGVLGLAKGMLLVVVITVLARLALPENSAIFADSCIIPYADKAVSCSKALVPPQMIPSSRG